MLLDPKKWKEADEGVCVRRLACFCGSTDCIPGAPQVRTVPFSCVRNALTCGSAFSLLLVLRVSYYVIAETCFLTRTAHRRLANTMPSATSKQNGKHDESLHHQANF